MLNLSIECVAWQSIWNRIGISMKYGVFPCWNMIGFYKGIYVNLTFRYLYEEGRNWMLPYEQGRKCMLPYEEGRNWMLKYSTCMKYKRQGRVQPWWANEWSSMDMNLVKANYQFSNIKSKTANLTVEHVYNHTLTQHCQSPSPYVFT